MLVNVTGIYLFVICYRRLPTFIFNFKIIFKIYKGTSFSFTFIFNYNGNQNKS